MCGRFTQTKSRAEVLETLGEIELPPLFHGRYNMAPTQNIAIIRSNAPHPAAECIWGFQNPRSSSVVINARSETLGERPMFRDLLAHHRCLVPSDGFYEWKDKQPYYFQLPQKQLFAFAGLWRDNRCVILTRAADAHMQGIHSRMPIIIPPTHWDQWLAPSSVPDPIFNLQNTLTVRPVSRRINSVANDDPECLVATEVQTDLFGD